MGPLTFKDGDIRLHRHPGLRLEVVMEEGGGRFRGELPQACLEAAKGRKGHELERHFAWHLWEGESEARIRGKGAT